MKMNLLHTGIADRWYNIFDDKNSRLYLLIIGYNHDEIILFDFGNRNMFKEDIEVDFMKICGKYNFENRTQLLQLFQNKFPELIMCLESVLFKISI